MNPKNNTQDSMAQLVEVSDTQIQQTYHEVLIDVDCKQQYLQDIIIQSIADIILDYGDGVEFVGNVAVKLDY